TAATGGFCRVRTSGGGRFLSTTATTPAAGALCRSSRRSGGAAFSQRRSSGLMAQPGQGTAGEVLVLLSDSESAARFAEMLARSRHVTIGESEAAISGRYDLGIVDGPMLHRIWRRIAERKRAEAPTLLPFLLVTAPHDVGLFARFLWTAVDELIQAPVQTPELLARVDVLLRVREASVRLRNHGEERFRLFFDSDPASRWVAAPDGRILLCNAVFAARLGFPSVEEACRHTWSDVIADPVAATDFGAYLAN